MATPYSLWSKSKRGPARVTWVSGTEPELAREVCTVTRAAISAEAIVLFASITPEPEIWSACMQYPLPGQQRLVIVHDAGKLKQLLALDDLLDAIRTMQGAYVLFTGEWPDGQEAVQSSSAGQVVRCSFPADEDKARQGKAAWLCEHMPGATLTWAQELLERVDGDFSAAAVVCAKARLCGLSPGQAMQLADGQAQPLFVDLLVLGERKAALRAAQDLGREDYGRVTAQLASRLTVMSTLYRVTQDSVPGQPMHKLAPEVPAFLVKRFRKVAQLYSPLRVQQQRELLDIADSAYRSGAREGVLEVLCAGW